jgi:hypothetical protein
MRPRVGDSVWVNFPGERATVVDTRLAHDDWYGVQFADGSCELLQSCDFVLEACALPLCYPVTVN